MFAKLVVFLLLGAIVNVAVAWGCAAVCGDVTAEWSPYHSPRGRSFVVHVTSRLGYEQVRGVGRSGTLLDRHGDKVRRYRTGAWWPPEAVGVFETAYGIAVGWPLLALSTWRTTDAHQTPGVDWLEPTPVLHWGVVWDQDALEGTGTGAETAPMIFPLRPIWPGFAINTIFYAAILWLLTLGPFTARRFIRRNRGHCIKCGYDLRGDFSAGCPECGWRRDSPS